MIGPKVRGKAGLNAPQPQTRSTEEDHGRSCSEPGQDCSSEGGRSMDLPWIFRGKHSVSDRSEKPFSDETETCVSDQSNRSKNFPVDFSGSSPDLDPPQSSPELPQDLDHIFMILEQNIVDFVKEELKRLKSVLKPKSAEVPQSPVLEDLRRDSEAFLCVTLNFLRRMKQPHLADVLQSSWNEIYTELYITEERTSLEHEVWHLQTFSQRPAPAEAPIACEDIFRGSGERSGERVRMVLTKGVAGVGKTVLTQKFSLDWAAGRANRDIQLLFPFTFRELNVLRDAELSLVDLLQHFYSETTGLSDLQHLQILFIFDGLDESRLSLDFARTRVLTEPTESSSVEVLLVNLIRGDLLPSARLWITTRPAAANQIPAQFVSMVTEVRGFNDPQKEQYFRRRFSDEQQASAVISHIKTCRSLYNMCYIPVFCWITSTVLENVMRNTELQHLPKTLTDLYIHFLVVQLKRKNVKYSWKHGTDTAWSLENKKMVESLGKLAFEQLQKGNLIFYESDLSECGLDAASASVYSGLFTQIFREEPGLYQDKVYCFIHLSVQEFLAALHVHQTFFCVGVNLLSDGGSPPTSKKRLVLKTASKVTQFYELAVDQALRSPNGHLDLFLRFLLGLSLPANQKLLHGLLARTLRNAKPSERMIKHVRGMIREQPSERSLNLFHCLNELKDQTLASEIQMFLRSGRLDVDRLSPAQWSTLIFLLLSSVKDLEEFDLREYGASEEALLKLLPVVRASTKAVLSGCGVSWRGCQALSRLLRSPSSSLRHLDLSNNELSDCGVKLLSAGLEDPQCALETLSLSGCCVSEEGCAALASALNSNPLHLGELDLSYNAPGEAGVRALSAGLNNTLWRLDTLSFDHCGALRLTPGPRKFFCSLTLDLDTAFRKLLLTSDLLTAISARLHQPYPDHPLRFDFSPQLLCAPALPARCYWEVQWRGAVHVAVAREGIERKNNHGQSRFGMSGESWCLSCSRGGYSVWHNGHVTSLAVVPRVPGRVGVFLDRQAGALSFYMASEDHLLLLHSFSLGVDRRELLFAGFGFGLGFGFGVGAGADSVSLVRPPVTEG